MSKLFSGKFPKFYKLEIIDAKHEIIETRYYEILSMKLLCDANAYSIECGRTMNAGKPDYKHGETTFFQLSYGAAMRMSKNEMTEVEFIQVLTNLYPEVAHKIARMNGFCVIDDDILDIFLSYKKTFGKDIIEHHMKKLKEDIKKEKE